MEAVQAMLESQQNKLNSQSSQTFSYHVSYIPFLQQLIEEKSKLEKSMKAVQAMLESQQNKLNSQSS